MSELVPVERSLPPVHLGSVTPENRNRVELFFFSVANIFEAWVNRGKSENTRRAYRGGVMAFVHFMSWQWPEDAMEILPTSILEVQAWKKSMTKATMAPRTLNRLVSFLPSLFNVLAEAAAGASRSLFRIQRTLNSSRVKHRTLWKKRERFSLEGPGN